MLTAAQDVSTVPSLDAMMEQETVSRHANIARGCDPLEHVRCKTPVLGSASPGVRLCWLGLTALSRSLRAAADSGGRAWQAACD
jgi:hypothetical protein